MDSATKGLKEGETRYTIVVKKTQVAEIKKLAKELNVFEKTVINDIIETYKRLNADQNLRQKIKLERLKRQSEFIDKRKL